MAHMTSLFQYHNREIVTNKRKRFSKFLLAAEAGMLFERPAVRAPYVAHVEYASPPIWSVLQSSYDDVEKELDVMRNFHLDKRILFVGGDGLSVIRMNHLLRDKPDVYIDSCPFIIPMQGEAPHGVYHVMHGGWRLYSKFIRAAADATLGPDLGPRAIVDDPNVKNFNSHIYALYWMTRACAEYVLHIHGNVEEAHVDEFLTQCDRNIDLAWIVHFLYDFAFLVLDFKQSVRANQSHQLDLLWREFYSIGHTSTANKTHYVVMAVMRIFWGNALDPDLQRLYHALRAIPMSEGVHVGWDTPIEWLNGAITEGVHDLVSQARIADFIRNFAFMDANYACLLEYLHTARDTHAKMKDMDCNVDAMKAWLIAKVGPDWESATRHNSVSNLGIGAGRRGPTPKPPWVEVEENMMRAGADSVHTHVASTLRGLTSTFFSFIP